MCRLAFCNRAAFEQHSLREWAEFFHTLQDHMGGHGNGVAIRTQHNEIITRKGVELRVADAVVFLYEAYEAGAQEFLFHTRLTSAGEKCDGNCHPFATLHSAIAHNGHDYKASRLARGVESDTAWIARALFNRAIRVRDLDEFSGTYIGWYRGVPFAVSSSPADCVVARWPESGAWLIASEIPTNMSKGAFTVDDCSGYYFYGETENGAYMAPRPALVRAKSKYGYEYEDYYWDRDYTATYYDKGVARRYKPQPKNKSKEVDSFDQWYQETQAERLREIQEAQRLLAAPQPAGAMVNAALDDDDLEGEWE